MERKEPTAGLVDTFGDEVSRARGICVLKRIVVLCVRHSTRVKPYIDEVEFALHGFARRRNKDDAVHVRTVQIDDGRVVVLLAIVTHDMVGPRVGFHETCLDGFVDFCKEFGDGTDTNLFGSVFGAPDRQRCTPITGTGEVPIVEIIEPLTETTRTGGFGLPVDGLVEGDHLVPRHSRFDEPRVKRIVDDGFVGTPAMRIGVDMLLGLKQPTIGFHLETEVKVEALIFLGQIGIVRILDETSGVFTVQFGVDVRFYPFGIKVLDLPVFTGKIDHRTWSVVLSLHIETRNTGCIAYFFIVRTESRRDMHDTRTVFGRHIVTRDDTEGTRTRVHPREERIIFESDKVCTFVTGYDLSVLEISG